MTDEQLYKALDLYEAHMQSRITSVYNERDDHILRMIPQMREFIEDGRREKVMRWLGFIQGALWAMGDFTVEELKSHNTSP